MSDTISLRLVLFAIPFVFATAVSAQDDFERPPIAYSTTSPNNCISRLQNRLDHGELELERHETFGYLPAVLKALDVPTESQMFVFSKTSLQVRYISPRTPRAIYFNDNVYVGYCQNGDMLEISAVDPQLGTAFYTLEQQSTAKPRFERRIDNCLICHSSSRIEGIPGHLVRSLFTDGTGQPVYSGGSRSVDHTTPLEQRWGGWYVTGTHGPQQHLGNLVVRTRAVQEPVDNSPGYNVNKLNDRLDVDKYLTPHSDIVALMVLEHQILVHNRLTKANFDTRQAIDYDVMMNRLMHRPDTDVSDTTARRIKSTGDRVVDALLLVGEAKLTAPICGTAGYSDRFQNASPRDPHGRSLRDLDLTRRLFKYPCSYLIYSEAFDGLPRESKDYVFQRLWDILSGKDPSEKFGHLDISDRQAIIEILRTTKADLPGYWRN